MFSGLITPQLLFVELRVGKGRVENLFLGLVLLFLVYKAFNGTSFEEVFLNDFGNVVRRYLAVKYSLGVNYHYRTESAKTETSGLHDLDLVFKTLCGYFSVERFLDLGAARRGTAGTAAYKCVNSKHSVFSSC